MNHADGYWESVGIPELEDRAPRSTWETIFFIQNGSINPGLLVTRILICPPNDLEKNTLPECLWSSMKSKMRRIPDQSPVRPRATYVGISLPIVDAKRPRAVVNVEGMSS